MYNIYVISDERGNACIGNAANPGETDVSDEIPMFVPEETDVYGLQVQFPLKPDPTLIAVDPTDVHDNDPANGIICNGTYS